MYLCMGECMYVLLVAYFVLLGLYVSWLVYFGFEVMMVGWLDVCLCLCGDGCMDGWSYASVLLHVCIS